MAWIRACGGNPYLRYDKDNDQIQALDTLGNWVDIYSASQLPIIPSFDMFTTKLSDYTTSKSGDAPDRTNVDFSNDGQTLKFGVTVTNGNNAGVVLTYTSNFTVNFSNYSRLKISGLNRCYTSAQHALYYADNGTYTLLHQFTKAPSTDVGFNETIDISNITGEHQIRIYLRGYSTTTGTYTPDYLKFNEFKFMG